MTDYLQTASIRIMQDEAFQAACQRYAHANGSSGAIASAAVAALHDKALSDIAAERQRQITAKGYDQAHDDAHEDFELARAASVYALFATMPALDRDFALRHGPHLYGSNVVWPWDRADLKLTTRRTDLVKAGALILAEIERLDRKEG